MGSVVHEYVVLWEATRSEAREEGAIAAVQDVYFRVGEPWVLSSVDGTVLLADKRSPMFTLAWQYIQQERNY